MSDRADKVAATLAATTFSSHASFIARCRDLVAAALRQERQAALDDAVLAVAEAIARAPRDAAFQAAIDAIRKLKGGGR
jgi:hypothetical protein